MRGAARGGDGHVVDRLVNLIYLSDRCGVDVVGSAAEEDQEHDLPRPLTSPAGRRREQAVSQHLGTLRLSGGEMGGIEYRVEPGVLGASVRLEQVCGGTHRREK